jgi:FAD/FMN-containing dehydrogenase
LACNAVVSAQLVAPNGEILTLDHATNRELFWAIRGGLANFGVVTQLRIELVHLPTVQAGYLTYPIDQALDVLATGCSWAMDLPDTITSTTMVVNPPDGAFAYIGLCCVDDSLDMDDVLKPLASLGAPVRNTVRKMPAAQLGEIHLDPLEPAASVSDARLVDGPLAIEGLASEIPGQDSPLAMVEFRRLGGAVGRPVPGHGALNHLAGDFLLFCLGIEGASGTRAEITSSFERVAQIMGSPGRTALNFIDDPIAARSEFPSTTYTRLQQIRRSIDPGDLMRASHPIELPSD